MREEWCLYVCIYLQLNATMSRYVIVVICINLARVFFVLVVLGCNVSQELRKVQ